MAIAAPPSPGYDIFRHDRPGWIPERVGDDWDPHPYAYQTEEALMPAGRFHGLYLQTLAEMFGPLLERLNFHLLLDVFLFYRDWEGRKQRIAPDALIAPVFPDLTEEQAAQSYNLDVEPLPLCVVEIVSPGSRLRDLERKPLFYGSLGISECLVLDILDDQEHLRSQILVSLWRLGPAGMAAIEPDDEGYVVLETIGVRLRADGRQLVAQNINTGEMLHTSAKLLAMVAEQAQALAEAEQARVEAERRALAAQEELASLRAELDRLRKEQS